MTALTHLLLLGLPLAPAFGTTPFAPPLAQDHGQEHTPGGPDLVPKAVELEGAVARIPFSLGGGRPVPLVEAMVNGKGPFKFFYDTGASACVLDTGFVEELGIPVLGETEIGDHTASARIPAVRVEMESLELEGIRFEGVPAIAFDRGQLHGAVIRGVLGLPLFREHLLTIDYRKGLIEVSDETLPEEGPGIVPYGGALMPEITIQVGDREISCHIDSGSPTGLMLPTAFAESLPRKGEPKKVGEARTVNSVLEIWSVQLDGKVVIAGNEYVDPEVGYNEMLPNALIGYQLLKDLVLSMDQRSKRVRLVPAEAEVEEAAPPAGAEVVDARRPERRRLGVGIGVAGAELSVAQVVPGSEAEKAGLRVGDVLRTIDGAPATQEALGKTLEGAAPIRLTVERGGATVEVVLFADSPE